MRPLEPGQPQRKVRALDAPRRGGLHRQREQDEDFRDLLDDALQQERPPETPDEPDTVDWNTQNPATANTDGFDTVEIRSRPVVEAAANAADPPADNAAAPGKSAETPAPDPSTPELPGDGRPRLDLKA